MAHTESQTVSNHRRGEQMKRVRLHTTIKDNAPFKALFAFLLLVVLISSCDTRRPILERENYDLVVAIDWKQCGLSPVGASIYAYNTETGKLVNKHLTNYSTDVISLPKGRYTILVFNETVDDYDNIVFKNEESLGEFTGTLIPNPNKSKLVKADPDLPLMNMPEDFAVIATVPIDVSRSRDIKDTIKVAPKRLTMKVRMNVSIHNINSLATSGHKALLNGVSDAAKIYSGELSSTRVSHANTLNNLTYNEGSTTDGTLSANFRFFGFKDVIDNKIPVGASVTLYLKLRDGTDYTPFTRQISSMKITQTLYEVILEINIGDGIVGGEQGKDIILPIVVGGGGGFDADVGGWKDENIEVPV